MLTGPRFIFSFISDFRVRPSVFRARPRIQGTQQVFRQGRAGKGRAIGGQARPGQGQGRPGQGQGQGQGVGQGQARAGQDRASQAYAARRDYRSQGTPRCL